MPKKIKLNLDSLNVTSFSTTKAEQTIKGGITGPRCSHMDEACQETNRDQTCPNTEHCISLMETHCLLDCH